MTERVRRPQRDVEKHRDVDTAKGGESDGRNRCPTEEAVAREGMCKQRSVQRRRTGQKEEVGLDVPPGEPHRKIHALSVLPNLAVARQALHEDRMTLPGQACSICKLDGDVRSSHSWRGSKGP